MQKNTNQLQDQINDTQQLGSATKLEADDGIKSSKLINLIPVDEKTSNSFLKNSNTLSFNSLLPNDSLLSLLLRSNVTIIEILSHSDFTQTFESNNNTLIEKICYHMKEIIDLIKVDDNRNDRIAGNRRNSLDGTINYYQIAHHASEIISSDYKEISYLFFPPKDKNSQKKNKDAGLSLYNQNDTFTIGITSANESDAQLISPFLTPNYDYMKESTDIYNYMQCQSFELKRNNNSSSHCSSLLSIAQKRNSLQIQNYEQSEQSHDEDYLKQFLSQICDFKTQTHSISISNFYQRYSRGNQQIFQGKN